MKEIILHTITVFMGFFAIMNPIANTPIFLGLTNGADHATVKSVALRSVIIAFIIVTIFAISGKIIFDLFGITLYALRITGGILVFMIGFNMLQGKSEHTQSNKNLSALEQKQAALGIAVSPLAMPILAGPGTIATAMNFAAVGGNFEVVITILAFGVLCGITFLLFVSGEALIKALGASVLGVITRMMGLILAVIGMQMFIEGVHQAMTALSL
ncbi:MarC family protein [Vibrio superstes]|uniref:UPF0056 membrane protein n=1 Tax=Vibrio superstes NBRC 103154 TaxID=1219062 RepID=A0A511QS45_9VIBR|nr:MarC family protein [Vibrio superstes]GEM80179.1 UPF0056 inner membrane protein [Vibrio superstes NBRC 103154]